MLGHSKNQYLLQKTGGTIGKSWHDHSDDLGAGMSQQGKKELEKQGGEYKSKTTGWKPTCKCNEDYPFGNIPCTVLDLFGGAMTTALVAHKLGRKFIMIELSQKYIDEIGIPRIEQETRQLKLFN